MARNIVASSFLMAALLGCNGGTSPSADVDLTGTWVGTAQENFGGNGTFRATLTQSGSVISGSWVIGFPPRGSQTSGTLIGTVVGSSLVATLTPSDRSCPMNLSAITDGTEMRGTYLAVNCAAVAAGSISVLRL